MFTRQNSKDTKFCPRIGKSCIQEECIDWVSYPAERLNELTGKKIVEPVFMCNAHWQTKIAFDAARFADEAGASIDDLRNHVARGNAQMLKISRIKLLENET